MSMAGVLLTGLRLQHPEGICTVETSSGNAITDAWSEGTEYIRQAVEAGSLRGVAATIRYAQDREIEPINVGTLITIKRGGNDYDGIQARVTTRHVTGDMVRLEIVPEFDG